MLVYLYIIFLHWIADFVCQTDKMARGKSKNWKDLLSHTLVYSLIMSFGMLFVLNFSLINILLFGLTTFMLHTITDYFTSRLNSKLWADNKVHNFFVSVGFDQVLHYTQLFLTYSVLV